MTDLQIRYNTAKRALFDKAYRDLNREQRDAVFTVNNPLLILAGAGSGKTTVLVKRIAFIVKYGNAYRTHSIPPLLELDEEYLSAVEQAANSDSAPDPMLLLSFAEAPCPPWQVLAITFTNKAANEIKTRLASALEDADVSKEIWAGTFHSVCMRILRVHCSKLGYSSGMTVYDTDDTKKAMSTAMKECDIDEKTLPLKSVMNAISRAKEKMLSPTEYELTGASTDFKVKQIAKIYNVYQNRLKESNAMDFDDIIMQTVVLLRDYPEVLEYYQNRFKYICVDEFQDTNKAQLILTSMLADKHRNLMVVGDDDQSIYSFRGAVIENILNFDKLYADAKVIRLEQNYRSTETILNAANSIIGHNKNRHSKVLRTDKKGGEKITVRQLNNQNDEARYIIDVIRRSVQHGTHEFRDYAILYRTNAQSSTIERAFARSGLPYRMLGGTRFNDREEIRDITAYLQLINNHSDRERLKRIINKPRRKIGQMTIDAIGELADHYGISMFSVIENADKYVALGRSANTLLEFAGLINKLTNMINDMPLDVFVKEVLSKSGYRQSIVDKGEEEKDRLDNLDEFVSGIIDYMGSTEEPTLTGFLEENALVAEVDKYDNDADAVVMMTIHSAKGLEFPVVFLPGMEDGIFPGMQTITEGSAAVEEERRLAYVAVTRAKNELYILSAESRLMYGKTSFNPPSRFLNEIPKELLDIPAKEIEKKTSANGEYASSYANLNKSYREPYGANITYPVYNGGKGAAHDSSAGVIFDKSYEKRNSGKKIKAEELQPGDRVQHIKFGAGDILSVKAMGADYIYEIIFDTVGIKKLMASYANLKKL